MNSLKSFCSFTNAGTVSLHEVQQHVQAFLRRQGRIEIPIGSLSICMPIKDPDDALHGAKNTTRWIAPGYGRRPTIPKSWEPNSSSSMRSRRRLTRSASWFCSSGAFARQISGRRAPGADGRRAPLAAVAQAVARVGGLFLLVGDLREIDLGQALAGGERPQVEALDRVEAGELGHQLHAFGGGRAHAGRAGPG